jgi:hypothetical protein
MEKICNTCQESKDISYYQKDKQKKTGYNNKCKNCKLGKDEIKKYNFVIDNKKICGQCNIEKHVDYYQISREKRGNKVKNICKECTSENRKTIEFKEKSKLFKSRSPEYKKEYRKDNLKYKEQQLAYSKSDKRKNKLSEWNKKQYDNNPKYKLICLLRNRLFYILKDKRFSKNKKTLEILGDSIENVKKFIEDQFIEGMTWENHGEWHIDHKKPLSSAQTEEEIYKLCHYSNLQPLWAFDNLSKGSKYSIF